MSPVARQAAYLKKSSVPTLSFKWVSWVLPLVVACAVLFIAKDYFNNPNTLPVNKIRVHGEFINVDEAMLHKAVSSSVSGGYFNVDVEQVRTVVEKLAWVSEASVRRVWPDTLSVSILEQKPIATSKNLGLINKKGDLFKPERKMNSTSLPIFEGNTNLNKLMISKYNEMNKLLIAINRKIVYLKLDARHALELKLDNELKIVLGRGDTAKRLERFILIYHKVLARRASDIEIVDLRYTNGMSISWKKNIKHNKGLAGDTKHV